MPKSGMPTWIAPVAGVVATITGVVAAAFAIWKTTVELKRWRTERPAQVAGEVLVATLRFLSELRGNTTPTIRPIDEAVVPEGVSDAERFHRAVETRWANFRLVSDRFDEAWAKAETHLPDEVSTLLEEVSDAQRSIWAAQVTSIGSRRSSFDEGFGSGPQKRIEDLRKKVRTVIRPLARGEKPSTP